MGYAKRIRETSFTSHFSIGPAYNDALNASLYAGISKRSQRGGLENRLPKRHGGSNPSSCAKKKNGFLTVFLLNLISGTSIGANVSEALRGQSKADFSAKMCIALKEANESHYWVRLLYKTDFLTEQEFNSIENDVVELIKILSSICKTSTK